MCGIAGIYSLQNEPISENKLKAMTRVLAHRGPDGEGYFVEGPVGLGHRRLSIIDLQGGAQPMASANGKVVISYNGEIYNYRELREQLSAKGYTFKTQSDTEVILALYERHGADCLNFLNGMFTIALWDRERQQLVLARDRIGIKPLYYAKHNDFFYFASEIKAIRSVLNNSSINPSSVNSYFMRQYIGGADTIFEEIQKLPPGELMIVTSKKTEVKTYWRPEVTGQAMEWTAAAENLEALLSDAASSHLVSDVPVGIFLSGGLDSSCALAFAGRNATRELHTFSVGFGENSSYSETQFAKKLAEQFGTIHHEIHVTADEVLQTLPGVVANLDEPLADYAILPTYVMSKFAAEHVKVVLSGEGADELFGGYKRYHFYAFLDLLSKFGLNGFFGKNLLPGPSLFNDQERRLLLNDCFTTKTQLPSENKMLQDKNFFSQHGHLNSMLFTDLRNWLVDDLLMKVDKMGMLASIEGRVPYLDHRIVEFVLPLKGEFKVGLKQKKRLLKEVARHKLPNEIWQRPKHGFTVPVSEWLKGPLRQQLNEMVVSGSPASQWIDNAYVNKLIDRHERGDKVGFKLWSIFIFSAWMESCLSP